MLPTLPLALALLAAPPAPASLVETIHDVAVEDPYRALEEDAAGKAFAREQNEKTDQWLASHRLKGMKERLDVLLSTGYVSRPAVGGDKVFFVKMEGRREQPLFMVREGKRERVLLDLGKEDPSGKTALDWFFPSFTGRYVAYGISKNGDEDSVLHIKDANTGKLLKDRIPDTRWCDVTWLRDDSGFFYRRFPAGQRYSPRIYFHQLGKPYEEDEFIFGEGLEKTYWPGTALTEDGTALIITVSRGWSASDLYWMDLKTRAVRPIVKDQAALFENAFGRGGRVYVITNQGAPRGRLVRIDPDKPEASAWETILPEGANTLKSVLPLKDRLLVRSLDRAVSRLHLYDNDGKAKGEVALPGVGTVSGMDGRFDDAHAVLEFTTFITPPHLLSLDTSKADPPAELASVKTDLKLDHLVVEQVMYRSYDGTPVPMFLVHDKQMKRDGTNGVLLTGYGGFNISYTPSFARRYLYWLEQGGVLAVANLRGGGELGEAWHEAGRKQNKHQVFRDFEYAMRFLIRENYTRPDRLCITGGSNGGLLMGAMITQVPHLFAASYAAVGLYDMIRYHRWPPAELWIDEYGSSDNPKETPYLWAYSPYHQVMDGVRYPAVFIATAEQDTRVTWIHSAKFTARLQAAQAGTAPILMHMEGKEGHGQGKGRSDQVEDAERMFTFLLGIVPLSRAAPSP